MSRKAGTGTSSPLGIGMAVPVLPTLRAIPTRRGAGVSPCHAGIPTGIPEDRRPRTPTWQPKRSLHELSATINPEWIRRISCAALH